MRTCLLLIEHDAALRDLFGRALRDAGYLVMALPDADEAIDLLCLVAFDVVLVDAGTLRFTTGRTNGLTALVRVLRTARLLRFTTPATMGPEGSAGALLLEQPGRDISRLLGAIDGLIGGATAPLAV